MLSLNIFKGRSLFISAIALAAILAAGATTVRAAAGDIVADRELGQPDFFRHDANVVDRQAFSGPNLIAIDKSAKTNRLYVADTQNNRVLGYKNVAALANNSPADIVIGQPDFFSTFSNNGGTSESTLSNPRAVAVDKAGNLYVADTGNSRVLEFAKPFASGAVAGFKAQLVLGQALDFTSGNCNVGGPPTAETLCTPAGVGLDSGGNLYVADSGNNRVLLYTAPFNAAGDAKLVFGQTGFSGFQPNGGANFPSAKTLFNPTGIAVDVSGNLYVADLSNNRVLEYTTPLTNGTTAELVFGQPSGFAGSSCNFGGSPSASTLCNPGGVVVDAAGDVFIADGSNNRVLEYKAPIAASPVANTVLGQAGNFNNSQCDGGFGNPPTNATLCGPDAAALDSTNDLWVGDNGNNRVVKYCAAVSSASNACVTIGQPDANHKSPNSVDPAGLNFPSVVAIDFSATPNRLYVVDLLNNRVLGYKSAATFANFAPADLVIGQPDFYSGNCNQGAGPTSRSLCIPTAAAVDAAGNLFVADESNSRVLMFPTPFSSGPTNEAATLVFGQGGSFTSNNATCAPAPTSSTGLCGPSGVAIDMSSGKSAGTLYLADEGNSRVLRYTPPFASNPIPTRVIGQVNLSQDGCNRSNGDFFVFPSSSAQCQPDQIAVDGSGNLIVADTINNRVLEYKLPSTNGPAASAVFGQLNNFTAQDCNLDTEHQSLEAQSICGSQGASADAAGNIYIADTGNSRVLEYNNPPAGDKSANLVFGQPSFFTGQCNLGSQLASPKTLCQPFMAVSDSLGNLYVADSGNNRVLEYDAPLVTGAVKHTTLKKIKGPQHAK